MLEHIPPYNPNLNLIERIWKFTRGELRSKYYGDFESFWEKLTLSFVEHLKVLKQKLTN